MSWLRLVDGEEVTLTVLEDEYHAHNVHFVDGAGHECTGRGCELCRTHGRPRQRYSTIVAVGPDQYIWEMSKTVAGRLVRLAQKAGTWRGLVLALERQGEGLRTAYYLVPAGVDPNPPAPDMGLYEANGQEDLDPPARQEPPARPGRAPVPNGTKAARAVPSGPAAPARQVAPDTFTLLGNAALPSDGEPTLEAIKADPVGCAETIKVMAEVVGIAPEIVLQELLHAAPEAYTAWSGAERLRALWRCVAAAVATAEQAGPDPEPDIDVMALFGVAHLPF